MCVCVYIRGRLLDSGIRKNGTSTAGGWKHASKMVRVRVRVRVRVTDIVFVTKVFLCLICYISLIN